MRTTILLLACLALLAGCAAHETGKGGVAEMLSKNEQPSDLSAEQEARLGDTSLSQGKPDSALVHYNRALNKDPENLAYRVRKGHVLTLANMDEAALKEFQAVLAKDPAHAGANEGAGLVYFKSGLAREAETHLGRALSADSNLWRSQNAMGIMDSHSGRYAEAVRRYEAALAAHPGAGEVENNLGVAWLMLGDAEKALIHLRAAVKSGAGDGRTYNNMGLALARLGREPEALEAFRYGGDEAKALNNLGYVFLLQGDNVRAASYFEQALQAAPSYYVRAAENLKRARMASNFSEASGQPAQPVPMPLPSSRQSALPSPRNVSVPAETPAVKAPAAAPAPSAAPASAAPAPAVRESSLAPEAAPTLRETVRSQVPVPTVEDVVPAAVAAPEARPSTSAAPEAAALVVPAAFAPRSAAPAAAQAVPAWGVHVGSWKDLADARRFAARVEALGLSASICKAEVPERGTWYRVFSGNFATAHEAAEARPAVLGALGLEQAAIYRLSDPVEPTSPKGHQAL